MKFRTDFVTNSSSSSFAVELNLQLEDSTEISLSGNHGEGDGNWCECCFSAKNALTKKSVYYDYIPYGYCVERGMPEEDASWQFNRFCWLSVAPVDILRISRTKSLKRLIGEIESPFRLRYRMPTESKYLDDEFEDFEEEYEGNADKETIMALIVDLSRRFNAMADACHETLTTHIT